VQQVHPVPLVHKFNLQQVLQVHQIQQVQQVHPVPLVNKFNLQQVQQVQQVQ
jgi:hypothetical protein